MVVLRSVFDSPSPRPPTMRTTSTFLALAAVSTVLSACERPPSWGEFNSIIVATSEDQWLAVADMVESALEARIITVRAEKTFVVTHQDPFRPEWERLQRFRQLLLIGTADDAWMTEVLALAKRTSFDPPEMFQVEDVWAKGQTATVLLLTTGDAVSLVDKVCSRSKPMSFPKSVPRSSPVRRPTSVESP